MLESGRDEWGVEMVRGVNDVEKMILRGCVLELRDMSGCMRVFYTHTHL